MKNRLAVVAVLAAGVAGVVSGCAVAQTEPLAPARVSIGGQTHAAGPPECTQAEEYWTIDVRDGDGTMQAVMVVSGDQVIPQFVKFHNVDGFTGSYYKGGVGDAHAELTGETYTVTGTASGINSDNPNKVVSTDFEIRAGC
ncbi:lipoprotein LpqH [Mycobacterium sp.]|uniref:lipoprotein LpqH n=1 Tax=Mycobacterium sp. TaxID=1785 RepID=UPI003A8651F1